MPLDPRAKRLLDMLGATGPISPSALSLDARRDSFVSLMRFAAASLPNGSAACRTEDRTFSGPQGPIRVRLYTPAESRADAVLPGLVYFHGGGLVAGSLNTHEPLCAALAYESGCRLISVDYRLAPENKFPAAVSDAWQATLWVLECAAELGIDPRRVGVAGDSAGATLAAVVCQMARETPKVHLELQLLMCPIMDFAATSPSRQDFGQGYLLDLALLDRDLQDYLPVGVSPTDPRVSPLRAADLRGLPPTRIHTAEFDPLRDEGAAYAHRLESAGVSVAHTCHPGMIHLFFAMGAVIPYAHQAIRQIGAEIASALGQGAGA